MDKDMDVGEDSVSDISSLSALNHLEALKVSDNKEDVDNVIVTKDNDKGKKKQKKKKLSLLSKKEHQVVNDAIASYRVANDNIHKADDNASVTSSVLSARNVLYDHSIGKKLSAWVANCLKDKKERTAEFFSTLKKPILEIYPTEGEFCLSGRAWAFKHIMQGLPSEAQEIIRLHGTTGALNKMSKTDADACRRMYKKVMGQIQYQFNTVKKLLYVDKFNNNDYNVRTLFKAYGIEYIDNCCPKLADRSKGGKSKAKTTVTETTTAGTVEEVIDVSTIGHKRRRGVYNQGDTVVINADSESDGDDDFIAPSDEDESDDNSEDEADNEEDINSLFYEDGSSVVDSLTDTIGKELQEYVVHSPEIKQEDAKQFSYYYQMMNRLNLNPGKWTNTVKEHLERATAHLRHLTSKDTEKSVVSRLCTIRGAKAKGPDYIDKLLRDAKMCLTKVKSDKARGPISSA